MMGFIITGPFIDIFAKLATAAVPVAQIAAARFLFQGAFIAPINRLFYRLYRRAPGHPTKFCRRRLAGFPAPWYGHFLCPISAHNPHHGPAHRSTGHANLHKRRRPPRSSAIWCSETYSTASQPLVFSSLSALASIWSGGSVSLRRQALNNRLKIGKRQN